MSIEKVKKYLANFGYENKVIELKDSSATVELAALALGCEAKRIAKTLSFWINDSAILIVCAGDAKVDSSKFKKLFGVKPKMLSFDEAENIIGHKVGGVCPFAINDGILVYLDESLKRFDTVFPACGSSNSAIELNIEELEKFSNNKMWVNICKNWQEPI